MRPQLLQKNHTKKHLSTRLRTEALGGLSVEFIKNSRQSRHRYINFEEIAYHQFRKGLHIIKTEFCISSLRKSIQPMADDIHAKA